MTSNQQTFHITIAVCGILSLFLTCLYHTHTMIAVDEFWFAHRIYEYASGIPYRDFSPYKTVLGYYLLLPAFLIQAGTIYQQLLFVKTMIAFFNVFAFILSSYWLRRHASTAGIIIAFIIVCFSEINLSYSSQIRVDLLGYWFCLFALLCVLDKRYLFAGVLLALGFMTTQKAIWYVFAINASLGLNGLLFQRHRQLFFSIIKMNITFGLLILLYIVLWSRFSSFPVVINNLFNDAAAMYQLDWYDASRYRFWEIIIRFNPFLYLLWPACLLSLFASPPQDTHYHARFMITMTSLAILACLVPYKQVFPYYMQVTIPILFLTYAVFFSWLFDILKATHITLHVHRSIILSTSLIYIITLIGIIAWFKLPHAYMLLAAIPLLISIALTRTLPHQLSQLCLILILITALFTDLFYPSLLLPAKINYLNNRYQRAHINTLEKLAEQHYENVAGIELLYNHTQSIPGLRHLMGPAVAYLYHPDEKLRRVMLASLYEDPNATTSSIIQHLKQSTVALFVNNYRMQALPPVIKTYLNNHYAHFWGSIYTYSPFIPRGSQLIQLQIPGRYRVHAKQDIVLDGHHLSNQSFIEIKKGQHHSYADVSYRLQWIPDIATDNQFQQDNPEKMIF